ncbi:MAG TPA: flagellar motor protein MotB [Bryobacteraceae bacterium]|jgi:chemotaxis protein MotB|nr:flagellar motor protein MotB [Bryobacteraceae bacterium]
MKHKLKPKYLEAEHGGQRERWLVSYTDFVTILLILFVAIAAQGLHSAQTPPPPPPQTKQKAAAIAPVEAATKAVPTESHEALVRADEKLRSQGLDSRLEKRGLVISLPQAILFPSGEDHVLPAAFPIVSQIADVLNSVPNRVALVGHSDSIPIHNKRFQNNWELSAARSVNLLEVLSSRYGIPESRLSIQSYGANDPKDSNDTEAGRAENRRVEILLLEESAQ